ncbi:MAG: hypothetical protein H0U49_06365 [Parachlamydiaceae bacterium]|nr:hypothetical protein [Parachlamydiaceae bacterium]
MKRQPTSHDKEKKRLLPIHASLVNYPENYPWSSHRAYLLFDEYTWLTRDNVLKTFGSTQTEVITTYESFVLNGIGIEPLVDFKLGHSKGILGDEEFMDEFLETIDGIKRLEVQLSELISKVCNHFNLSETVLCAPGKSRL